MKEQVKEMFAQVTMPEETERKVRQAMAETQKSKRKNPGNLRAVATLAAMMALVFVISPQARAAVNGLVRYVVSDARFIRDSESGEVMEVVIDEESESNMFIEVGDGKFYFSADGQYIDITDKTSMETPYIYTYVDDANIEHMLIIGGVPDNFGVSEFYREVVEGQQSWQGWIGGYSSNYIDNQTGKAYPWVAAAWEELDLPWPMPGD